MITEREVNGGIMINNHNSNNHNNQPKYLTVKELAHRWRLTSRTIKQYVYDGKLKALKLGPRGDLRIPITEVERYEQENITS